MYRLAIALIVSWAASTAAQESKPPAMSDAAKLPSPTGTLSQSPDLNVTRSMPTVERSLTEADVETIVARVLARSTPRADMGPAPSYPQPPAQASPQGYVAAESSPQQVAVYVPAGPIATGLARVGHKMARLGEPRVRTFRAAPVACVAATAPPPVYPSGQR